MGDKARAVVRAAAAAIPYVGGPLAVALEEFWQPRWLDQGKEFLEQLAEDVETMGSELYASVDELHEALDRADVAEVFHRAGRIAAVSAHAATRRRCRAAVLNAIRQPQNAAYNLRFVRLIDELAPAHFTLLALLEDPSANATFRGKVENTMMGGMSSPVGQTLGYDDDFVKMLGDDLARRGLGELPSGMMSGQGLLAKRTTDLGDRLLAFVRHPVAGDAD